MITSFSATDLLNLLIARQAKALLLKVNRRTVDLEITECAIEGSVPTTIRIAREKLSLIPKEQLSSAKLKSGKFSLDVNNVMVEYVKTHPEIIIWAFSDLRFDGQTLSVFLDATLLNDDNAQTVLREMADLVLDGKPAGRKVLVPLYLFTAFQNFEQTFFRMYQTVDIIYDTRIRSLK